MVNLLIGTYVAVITPFEEFNSRIRPKVNYEALIDIIDYVAPHVNGLVLTGSTGSNAHFKNINEHLDVLNFAGSYIRDKYPATQVIAGDGGNDIWEAIERVKRIEGETGINIHLSMSPSETKPSDESIYRHFYELAENTSGYFIPYSIPARTGGKGILPHIARRLARHPRIIGIKNCGARTQDIINATRRSNFSVLSGDDSSAVESIEAGARGLISTLGNLAPSQIYQMVRCALEGKYAEARIINENFTRAEAYSCLFPGSEYRNPANNPATTQYAMNVLGFNAGRTPTQIAECSIAEKRSIRRSISKLKRLGYIR